MATVEGNRDVASWLQSLDLEEFVEVFHHNGMFQVHQCTSLTESDLHALGITQTGYKKRILEFLPSKNQKPTTKPTLPPRSTVPSSKAYATSKPVARPRLMVKPQVRVPSMDSDEYFNPASQKSTLDIDNNGPRNGTSAMKPTILPRQSVNQHSSKPVLPQRKDRPQPVPRPPVVGQPHSTSLPKESPDLTVKDKAQIESDYLGRLSDSGNEESLLPSTIPVSQEEELLHRPLPPVPQHVEGESSFTEHAVDVQSQDHSEDISLKSYSLEPDDGFLLSAKLPERPPVIGAEDPPKVPARPVNSPPQLPERPSSMKVLPPRPLEREPPPIISPPPLPPERFAGDVVPSQTPSDLLTPDLETPPPIFPPPPAPVGITSLLPERPSSGIILPPVPSRRSPEASLPHPPERPGFSTNSPPTIPERPSTSHPHSLPTWQLPGHEISGPPEIPERPLFSAASNSETPLIPQRPSISYISPDISLEPLPVEEVKNSTIRDFTGDLMVDRPVPLPPVKQTQVTTGTSELEKHISSPPDLSSWNPFEVSPNHHQGLEENRQNGSGESDEENYKEIDGKVKNLMLPSSNNKWSSDVIGEESPLNESDYDCPQPPRRKETLSSEKRESFYDTPSSNQVASLSNIHESDFSLSTSHQNAISSRLLPSPAGHSFAVLQDSPPKYTNVRTSTVSSDISPKTSHQRYSRPSESDSESNREYDVLSKATSGFPSQPPVPTPPPRVRNNQNKEEYIFLSEASTGTCNKTQDQIVSFPSLGSKSTQEKNDEMSYSIPVIPSRPPIKPARIAPPPPPPPPPPVRQSSLSSLKVNLQDPADDTYHLVETKPESQWFPLPQESMEQSTFRECAQSEESEDDELEYPTTVDGQRMKDLHRISDCTMGQGDHLQRRENLRKSYREMRTSMHPQDSKLEKSGYLYKQTGTQGNRGFRKRYVVFRNSELRYYANEKELNESKGIVPVGTMRDVKYNTISGNRDKYFKIDLHTNGKILHFAAESLEEGIKWANTLMQAILSYEPPAGGFPVGGDMSNPDKQGYLKIDGYGAKRYVAVKGEILCVYKSEKDFEAAVAICDIEMKLANVKEVSKARLQLITPSSQYFLTADSVIEAAQWESALQEAIMEGLSDHQFLETVWQNDSNKMCAECSMKDPDWASINLGIVICKTCSGVHRNLGVHISKVRSLKMDEKAWTVDLLRMMVEVGNKNSNAFWESKLHEDDEAKLHPGDTFEDRQIFIQAKYKDMVYCERIVVEKAFLNRSLHNAVKTGSLRECIRVLFSGADPLWKDDSGMNAIDVAQSNQHLAIMELLKQNCDSVVQPESSPRRSRVPHPESAPTPPVIPLNPTGQEAIKLTGFLYKTGSNRKDFQRRYCVLEHGVFKYFADEKAQSPKNQIECFEMILVAQAEPRPNHQYCFDLCASSGRAYLFAADTLEESQQWMVALAKCQTLECMWDYLTGFDFAGYLKKKEGAASIQWQRLWFVLHRKFLYYYSVENDSVDVIDLRKMISLSVDDSKEESDVEKKISIVLPKKNLYFTTETDQTRELWFHQFEMAFRSASPTLDDQPLSEKNVPLIITACIKFVEDKDGLELEGVYRKSGAASSIKRITTLFSEDPRSIEQVFKNSEFEVHDVTSSLKKFFRELPEPLLTKEMYSQWIQTAAADHTYKYEWYKELLNSLPDINYCILKDLIYHLKKVDANQEKNSMNAVNLGTVFGPTLMASSDPLSANFQNAEREISVIQELITNFNWFFDVEEEKMSDDKEQEVKDAIDRIKNNEPNQMTAAGMIIEIFYGRKSVKTSKGSDSHNSFSIKLFNNTTSQDLIRDSIAQGKLQSGSSYAVFEIVSKGDLERMFHHYEYVLQNILEWSYDAAPDNYICIMDDYITPRVELYMKVLSSSDFVKFHDGKKSFKKMYFELNQHVLNGYKDKQSHSATGHWKVSEMKIYLGYDKKKSPPTQHCLTFTTTKDPTFKTLSFDTEDALNTFLGALFKSKTRPADDYDDESLDQGNLPLPSPNFNPPFTKPQRPSNNPWRLLRRRSQQKFESLD